MGTKETVSIPALPGVSYDVLIGPRVSAEIGPLLKSKLDARRATVISNGDIWESVGDSITASFDAAEITFDLIAIPEGESNKNLDTVALVYEAMADVKALRSDPVVAVGGGVVGDLAGFVAATYMRGVPFINMPTTLLSMTDSSIGGKTGVDLEIGKNLVGAFHQPKFVISDTDFLKTLPERELRSGLAEVIKTAFLTGGYYMSFVEDNIDEILALDAVALAETIKRAVRFKADVVAADPSDKTGRRAILNYGHTFGHAIETVGEYGGFNHGEAVAAGMMFAALLSNKLGLAGKDLVETTESLLGRAGLPARVAIKTPDEIINIMEHDKKNDGGDIRFVLLEQAGSPVLRNVTGAEVAALLKEI